VNHLTVNPRKPQAEMVAVDWPHAVNAGEIATVLSRAGLHPEFDARPLQAVKGRFFAKTAIYVPDIEASTARDVLAAWYAERGRHISKMTIGVWRGLAIPLLIAIGAVLGAAAGQFSVALGVTFLAFVPAVAVWHRRS
jgi:hypothetical protein